MYTQQWLHFFCDRVWRCVGPAAPMRRCGEAQGPRHISPPLTICLSSFSLLPSSYRTSRDLDNPRSATSTSGFLPRKHQRTAAEKRYEPRTSARVHYEVWYEDTNTRYTVHDHQANIVDGVPHGNRDFSKADIRGRLMYCTFPASDHHTQHSALRACYHDEGTMHGLRMC